MGTKPMEMRRLLRRGTWLGIESSTFGSILFWILVAVIAPVTTEGVAYAYSAVVIIAIATALAMMIPGAIGGACSAYALYQLSTREKLTETAGFQTGLVTGLLVGSILLASLRVAGLGEPKLDKEAMVIFSLTAGISILVGGWHGWRLGRWFLRHTLRGSMAAHSDANATD